MATKKYNFTFFQDLLREKRGGKYSSKKIWGTIVMTLTCASFILDGLHFYESNTELFYAMLTAGTTLLGLRVVTQLFDKSANSTKLAPSDEEQH